jgi:DNA-binding LacI/PurR family transcriptional regulator
MSRSEAKIGPAAAAGAATIYDVAARAGVSISTVSQTLNRPARVNSKTRRRVLEAIDYLGYMPKAAAVSQARRGVGRVGVLAPFTAYDSYRRRLMGVLAQSDGTNRDVVVFDHESAAANVSPLLRSLPVTGRLDGLLIMGLPLDDDLAAHLIERRLPTVLIDTSRPGFSTVDINNEDGGEIIGRHLVGKGHRLFAYVTERQDSQAFVSQGQQRFSGFLRALSAAGLGEDNVAIIETTNDIAGGRRALHDVLAHRPRPTAIYAHHDVLAAGVLLECRSQGISVPGEVAIAGFDDSNIAEAAGLTTVRQPFEESGRIGARVLSDLLAGAEQPVQRIVLGVELVARETT